MAPEVSQEATLEVSQSQETSAPEVQQDPGLAKESALEPAAQDEPEAPRPSLAERLQQKAADVAAREAKKAPAAKTPASPAPAAPKAPEPGAPAPAQTDPAAAAGYKPDFKYKFAVEGGQKQEAEFPDYLKGAITSKEQEDEIRSVFAKAKGLDFVKPRYERLRDGYQNLNQAHTTVMNGIEDLRAHYTRGDFDSFFARLQIPQEKVMQWILEKVQYAELPPEQRALHDSRRNAELKAYEAEQRLAALDGSFTEQAATTKSLALDSSLIRPEVAAVAAAYDGRAGKPESFKELVRSHGELRWYRSNGQVDLTPEQAIQEVVALYGLASQPATSQAPNPPAAANPAQGTQAAPVASGTQTPPQSNVTPVIPNVSGRASSPATQNPKPRNTNDLRKLYKTMAAQGQ